jgi:hypothetical protein
VRAEQEERIHCVEKRLITTLFADLTAGKIEFRQLMILIVSAGKFLELVSKMSFRALDTIPQGLKPAV